MTDFNFAPSQIATEVEKKLAIKRLPAWMQESEQIQKYFDDVIQHWFTPEQQRSLDGYIGLRGGVNSDDKVYVEEINKERQEYQLAPTMVSSDSANNVLAALTYPDLMGNLRHQGALTDNASRLLNGRLYSWAPPINPDMIVNYSNYYWDTTNSDGIKRPDYVVMQRDARDGNLWSRNNNWYPIQYTAANGAKVTITTEDITSGRFVQAQRPIIEFIRDIELINFGRNSRGSVDLVCETLLPEDIMFRSFTDSIKVDGVYLEKGHRVLFTSIANPGENNRIYKVTQELKNGKQVYGLILDSDEISATRPSGEPFINDTILVRKGTKYIGNILYWTGRTWKVGQQKTKHNQFPLFVLYNKNGKRLDNAEIFPGSTFVGSPLFSLKIDAKYPIDSVYNATVAVDKNGDNVYNNNLNSDVYTYINEGTTVEISKFRFYNVMNADPLKDQFFSEWREVLVPSRQYCRQLIDVVVDSKGVVKTYKMALPPEAKTTQYTNIKVDINGDFVESSEYTIKDGKITFKSNIKENDMITIMSYNGKESPDSELGVYEIPMNLKNNAANENIDYIEESKLIDHFMDIITNQVGFTGSANGTNNYNDTEREIDVGRKIAQHDASLIPLMVHNTSKNVDIINAIEHSKNAYTRFKNKFVNKLSEQYTNQMEANTNIRSIVVKLLNEINVGKTDEFPFWLTGMARTDALPQTFIPATPQYLGIVPVTKPRLRVKADIGYGLRLYNVSHTGVYSTCFSTLSMVNKSYTVINDFRDDVIYNLELMIYQSIHPQFTNEDYLPMLDILSVRPAVLRPATEYSSEEWDKIALRGFSSWATTNNVDYKTNTNFDLSDWRTWNYSSTMYRANNKQARGNWKAIHLDYFDTAELNTAPWQCFGFSTEPTWWRREYTMSVILNDGEGQRAYIDPKLWADIEAGIIRDGARQGTWPQYARKNFTKYNPVQADGTMVAPHQAVSGRLSLVNRTPSATEASADWRFGDIGDIEFMYMNTAYYAYDTAASLYRAKPAQWANYFWNATAYKKYTQGKYTQWLNATTDARLSFNDNTIVHGENDTRLIGYSMWVSDFLKYNHLDIARNYGDIVRGAGVKLSYRIGGFTRNENMTFVSDSFGLVSQENQHLRLLKSAVKRQEVMSGLRIVFERGRYRVSGYDTSYPYLTYFAPKMSSDKHYVKLEGRAFIKYMHWDETPIEIKYDTIFNTIQEVYTFISGYGEYLESKGWIFEDITEDGEVFDWHMMAFKFADWACGKNRATGDFVTLSPCARSVKFVSEHGNIENVTQFSAGSWSLVDDKYRGIGEHEIETARIGNFVVVRLNEDSDKRIMMTRVNTTEYEHMVIFDNTTIFNDVIYLPLYGLHQLRLKVYGTITDGWNGRLEAPGFMIVDNSTLPNFEKLVEDFSRYYDSENPSTSVELNNLARHFIGFQSREYLRRLILNERNQLDFYKGYIKEKGTMQVFDKVLRTSKSIRSTNYKVLEEWAFKVGEFGAIGNDQRLEFKLLNEELKQEPQMFRFNEAQTADDKFDATITYFGKQGSDSRWITRNAANSFPTIKSTDVKAFMPDCGPFNKNDMDFISQNMVDFTSRRIEKQEELGAMPKTALILNVDGTWDYVDIIEGDGTAIFSVVIGDMNSTQITFDRELTLQIGDRFFIDSPSTMMPSAVRAINYYYPSKFLDSKSVMLNIPQDMSSIDMNLVKLYYVRSRYSRESDRIALINNRAVDIVDISTFSKPVIYNAITNQTETYLSLFDPRCGVIPGVADSEITYKTMFDPALYNFINEGAAAWGTEKVGSLWWDTSKATYVDYHQPIRVNGVVDIEATRQYRRDNWGTLLPGGEIVLYEWVRSPVHPSEWSEYCTKQSVLNKTLVEWAPTGTAVEERWSEKYEYDAKSASVKKYYYFWVKDAYSVPQVPFRKTPASEIKRIIENPQRSGQPWFAPISQNEFIASGIDGLISDSDSILQLRYKADARNENNIHKEWKLFKEGEDYNFDEEIWTNMCNSLVGERVINSDGDTAPHEYPLTDVGNAETKTWFKDITDARREFVSLANEVFQNVNILANSNYVQTILNYTEKDTNPYIRNFVVTQYNGDLVLRISKPGIFSDGDAIMVKTVGELPSPLLETSVYFIEQVPDKTDLFVLKTVPNATMPMTLVNKGIGAHTIVRVEDLNKTDGTSLDMTKYWTTIDWYAVGYNSNTPFIEVTSLAEAETLSLSPTDVIKIYETNDVWALYVRDHSRNVPIWKTVGRKGSTIALNSNMFEFDRVVDGKITSQERLVRRALRMIFTMFESVQSRIVFGMVYHVVAEQPVVDWAFKTSYIHIIGIDKALASKTASLTDPLADVMEYFNEVKPYRTKIRAAMDQRTSDDDSIIASMRDTDPDPAEHQKYLDEMAKPESERNLSKIKARFRQSGTVLFFDNIQLNPNNDLQPAWYYEKQISDYLRQEDNETQLPEELVVSGCPNAALNGTYIEIFDTREIPVFDKTFAPSGFPFVDRARKIYVKHNGTQSYYIWNQIGIGWIISSTTATLDWYYEVVNSGAEISPAAYNVKAWRNADKKVFASRGVLATSVAVKLSVASRDDTSKSYVLERLMRDPAIIQRKLGDAFRKALSARVPVSDAQWKSIVARLARYTMDGSLYYDVAEFVKVCKEMSITSEVEMQRILTEASQPMKDVVTYYTLANRLRMYNPDAPQDYLDTVINGGFKGRQISNNPNTRIPFGYSASSDGAQDGYDVWSSEIYDKIRSEMLADGMFELDVAKKMIEYGYGSLVPYVPQIGFDTENGSITKSIHISDVAGLNDKKLSASPLQSEDLVINDSGYVDDLGAYDNLGYEKQSKAVLFDDVVDGQYLFDVHDLKLIDTDKSKFAVTIGKYQPEKTQDVDFGVYITGGKIQPGSTKGRLDVDYKTFNNLDPKLYSWDYGSQYGQAYSTTNGSFSVEGVCIRDPKNAHRLVVSAPRTIKPYATEWVKDKPAYPAAERHLYPFGIQIGPKDVPNTVRELRIGAHTLQTGDQVILLTNDSSDAIPSGAIFDNVNTRYYVNVINKTTVSLYTKSGTTNVPVTLNAALLESGEWPVMKIFSMFLVNPLKVKNTVTVDIFNYDAYYNRFLNGGELNQMMRRMNSDTIVANHKFKTGDKVVFTNIGPTDDVGELENNVEYFVNVLDNTTFQVMRTVEDAISGQNAVRIGVDVSSSTITCINFWLASTVSSVRYDSSWHFNYDLLSPEAKIAAMQKEVGTTEKTKGTIVVDHGFARPLIDKGSLREKVRMELQEHVSFTVYQDDRAVAESSKVYDSNKVHMYNTYTNGAAPFAFRIEKGHSATAWEVTRLQDADVRTLAKPLWYTDDEIHIYGELPAQGFVYIEGEYIKYKVSTTYMLNGKLTTKVSKLSRGINRTHENNMYQANIKVHVALAAPNEVNVMLNRSKRIYQTLPRSDYSYSTQILFETTQTGSDMFIATLKGSTSEIGAQLNAKKATYKGIN